MKRSKPLSALIVFFLVLGLVLALAGCGGSHKSSQQSKSTTPTSTTPTSTTPPAVGTATPAVVGHPCDAFNFAMQCALLGLPVPPEKFALPFAKYGWDFAWSCPNPSGKAFGASYFSFDTSKNWTSACVSTYHAQGAATVGVWETGADRATQGFNAGFNDAFSARDQARGVGEPDNRPIDYAVDCDCTASSIFYYFGGAVAGTAAKLHIPRAQAIQLVGIYGGYYQVRAMYLNHVVGHTNWQTYAWSHGLWLPASIAPLEQYLNSSSVDYDRAIAPDYGQWPYTVPHPGPSSDQVKKWIAARGASLHGYYKKGCHQPVLTTGVCGQLAWRVDHYQKLIDTNHGYYPRCFGPHRNLKAAECQVVRPAVAVWSRAIDSTVKAEGINGCESAQKAVHNPLCDKLRSRQKYFQGRINRTLATSRY